MNARPVQSLPALPPSPTAQAYAELQLAFDHYNRELFAGELPPCLMTMQREKRSYGYFSSEGSCITKTKAQPTKSPSTRHISPWSRCSKFSKP